jgi:hypothetical protein
MYVKVFLWISLFIIGTCIAAPPYLGEPPLPYHGELRKRAVDDITAAESDNGALKDVYAYPRRLIFGVYSEVNYKGQKQEWTNANGGRYWKVWGRGG